LFAEVSGAQTGCAAQFRPQAPGCGGIDGGTSRPKTIPLPTSPTSGGGAFSPSPLAGRAGVGRISPLSKGVARSARGFGVCPPLGCLGRGLELGALRRGLSEPAPFLFAGEFRSRPIQDHDRGLLRRSSTAGCPFFGYCLWANKESDLLPGNPRQSLTTQIFNSTWSTLHLALHIDPPSWPGLINQDFHARGTHLYIRKRALKIAGLCHRTAGF
jgi:hypothetical protein